LKIEYSSLKIKLELQAPATQAGFQSSAVDSPKHSYSQLTEQAQYKDNTLPTAKYRSQLDFEN